MSNLSEREILYRLLQIVLIDIRVEAYKVGNSRIFQLSDLFHTVPSQLIGGDRGEITDREILVQLMEKAQKTGWDTWLNNTVKNIP